MANWCRSIVRVLGPEPDVARCVAYIAQEDEDREGSLTQIAECCLEQRASGRAKYELLTKWRPPLDHLAEVARKFPALTLQAEWDQPGDGLLGCAVIVNGNRDVLELDDLVRCTRSKLREVYRQRFRDEWEDHAGCEADLVLGWEILREAARLQCGDPGEEQEEYGWPELKEFAREVVRDAFDAAKRNSEERGLWQEHGF